MIHHNLHCVLQEIDDVKATQPSTPAAGVSGDHSRTLSELHHMVVRVTLLVCYYYS